MWWNQLKNYWNPIIWVLIWEYSARAIQWIPTWQGLDDFQNLLISSALDESSLSIERVNWSVGMGTVENSTVRFGFRFCFYGSVLSRFPKRFINDISWIRNYAMECVAELAWTCKFLYTSSLASFSMLRRLLRIVKVAREQEAPFIVTLKWLFDRHTWQTLWGQQEVGAESADSFITPPACIENRTAWSEVRFQTG